MQNEKIKPGRYLGNTLLGAFLIIAGIFVATDKIFFGVSTWLVFMPIAIIFCGLLIGVNHKFNSIFWLVPVFWGVYLLLEVQFPWLNLGYYAGPLGIILTGIAILVVRTYGRKQRFEIPEQSGQSFTNITSVLNYPRKTIITDNFVGADITCFMGGAQVDLTNAEVKQSALLDVTAIFGGTRIIIPANWEIINDITAVFGAVEDKRVTNNIKAGEAKTVRLDGTVVFGGVEIISF